MPGAVAVPGGGVDNDTGTPGTDAVPGGGTDKDTGA